MLIKSANPKGIDYSIQQLQADLYAFLIDRWTLDGLSPDYTCYDRCYRNQTKDGIIPEVFTGKGYKEVLFDDKVKVLSFFDIENSITYDTDNNGNRVNVSLLFMVNLKKLKGDNIRPDEEVRQDVQTFLQHEKYGFMLNGIEIGLENVFANFQSLRIKYRDLNPLHCFRFNFTKVYRFTDHVCT